MDSGIHFSYLLRNTIGEVKSVVAFNANVLNDLYDFTPEAKDVATLILRFKKNILGCMTISFYQVTGLEEIFFWNVGPGNRHLWFRRSHLR